MSKWYQIDKTYIETVLVEVPDEEADPIGLAVEVASDKSKEGEIGLELLNVSVQEVANTGLLEAKEWADVVVPLQEN